MRGADFKYDNNFFKNQAQKYPNKTFLVPNTNNCYSCTEFCEFEGADFKYDNNIFKFNPKNTLKSGFFDLKIFVFSPNFEIRQI